jgi:hypothetical protein
VGFSPHRAVLQLVSVVFGVAAVTAYVHLGPKASDRVPVAGLAPAPAVPARVAVQEPGAGPGDPVSAAGPAALAGPAGPASTTAEEAAAAPAGPPRPQLNRAKLAATETALDVASRDRARAEDRADESARRLARAANQAALDALRARKLAFQIRDPSTRIARASSRGGFLRGQRERLATELAALRSLPRPKSTSILSKSPVARPADGEEYHFELRHDRISFIDLNKLLELTRADARLRIRMADRLGGISSKVGPVGSFSLAYELVPALAGTVEDLLQRRNVRHFDLKGWELVPESENRGETYQATQNPISEFTRALNKINPNRATITLWVYPDSFSLFRRIRNDLVERGFSIAARPLPEGLAIRGSPLGTQSAAQ